MTKVEFPTPLAMLEEFYVEPLSGPDPASEDWVCILKDDYGIALQLAFNYHINSVQTVLKLHDEEIASVYQEGAKYLDILYTKPRDGKQFPFLYGEFRIDTFKSSVTIMIFPRISVSWQTLYCHYT